MFDASTKPPYSSFAQFRKVVHLIHAALCIGLAIAIGLFWFAMTNLPEPDPAKTANVNEQALFIAACVVSVGCVGIGSWLPQFATSRVPTSQFALKLRSVVYARIMFAAAFEGGGLLWAVLGMIVRDQRYFLGSLAALGVMIVFFPTTSKLEQMLGMDEAQVDAALAGMGGSK